MIMVEFEFKDKRVVIVGLFNFINRVGSLIHAHSGSSIKFLTFITRAFACFIPKKLLNVLILVGIVSCCHNVLFSALNFGLNESESTLT